MSRQPGSRMAFASRTAFEALKVEGDDDYEEEEEEVDASPAFQNKISPQSAAPQSLSKSAQKKAARAARQAAITPWAQDVQAAAPAEEQQQAEEAASPDTPAAALALPPPAQEEAVAPPTERAPDMSPRLSAITPPPQTPVLPSEPAAVPAPPPAADASEVEGDRKPRPGPLRVHQPNGAAQRAASPAPGSPTHRRRKSLHEPSDNHTASKLNQDSRFGDGPISRSPRTAKSPPPRLHAAHKELSADEKTKKIRSIVTRTLTTLIMIAMFLFILALGQPFVVMLVLVCQALVYREVTALFELSAQGGTPIEGKGAQQSDDRWSKTLNWYFFAVANYFLYGESLIHYFKHVVFADAWLTPFATNHRFISFMLYMIGFVGFVSNLKRQFLRQQFGLFCWVHMSLLLIVVSSHFIVNNILEGLIWFWVPAALVICNDIFAYIWGMSIGRTPLIKLSPKKTVEGFVGAFFTTVIFAVFLATVSMKYDYMICPGHDLGVTVWDEVHCEKNPVFIWRDVPIGEPLITIFSMIARRPVTQIPFAPFQFHAVVMATFASLMAPFGGFFASGFKRAFGIKDFGDSLPGHGGMTDRMDCQFLMGMFSYVYYSSVIRVNHVTVGSILQMVFSSLSTQEQLELYKDLAKNLGSRGLINKGWLG